MGLVTRLNRLEQSLGVTGPCPTYAGYGVPRFTRGMDSATPDGCPMCGTVKHVRYVRMSDSEVERRRAKLLEGL